ncbi:GTPase-activating protein [Entomortierella beljakovae]|nr:GTPase-activating protein [Entomortierella beljakovae]
MMENGRNSYLSDEGAKDFDPIDNYGSSDDEQSNHRYTASKVNANTSSYDPYGDYGDYSDSEEHHIQGKLNQGISSTASASAVPTSPISSRGRDSYVSRDHHYTNGSQPTSPVSVRSNHAFTYDRQQQQQQSSYSYGHDANIDDYPSSVAADVKSPPKSKRNSWEEDSEEEPYVPYDYGHQDDEESSSEDNLEKDHPIQNQQQQQQQQQHTDDRYSSEEEYQPAVARHSPIPLQHNDYSSDEEVQIAVAHHARPQHMEEQPKAKDHSSGYHDHDYEENDQPAYQQHRTSQQMHHEQQHSRRSSKSSSSDLQDFHHEEHATNPEKLSPFYAEGESAPAPNADMFADNRASVNSAKSFSSHTKHHSFGYEDRVDGYDEKSDSESDSSSSESDGPAIVQPAATIAAASIAAASIASVSSHAPPIPSRSRPTSSSFSVASVSNPSSPLRSRFAAPEHRELKEEPAVVGRDVTVAALEVAPAPTPAPIPVVAVVPVAAPVAPVVSPTQSPLAVDTVSQKSVSTASSFAERREKRYSESSSDTSDTSIDLHSPTFKDTVKRTPPTLFNRTMSSISVTRETSINRGSSSEKTRPISYATVFSDADMNDVNLMDEPLNDKRVSQVAPTTPSTPSAFGFTSSFFGGRTTAVAPAPTTTPPPRPPSTSTAATLTPATTTVETRSRSTSISAFAGAISGAFRGFGSQAAPPPPPVPALPRTPSAQGTVSDRTSIMSNQTTDSNMDMLLARLEAQNELLAQDSKRRATTDSEMDRAIDYWGALMHDYNAVVKRDPRRLPMMIQKGVPPALRGLIWQLLAKSKDLPLEGTYAELLKSSSVHEKQITRDLSRTFPSHEYFQAEGTGQEALFNVVKAYSLYDPEVGYCQGLSFVVGPLLLNMPEEEAFCMLVRMMNNYAMRGNYTPDMSTLQLRLFQFEQLLEETLPLISKHLRNQGIRSTMYASQWFMTLFAYKFPLELVFRVVDIILVEGIESILRFAIALLKANHDKILSLDFEVLVEYLKDGLFEYYMNNNASLFIQDAYNVKVTPKKLAQYAQKHQAMIQKQQAEIAAEESLKESNRNLIGQVRQLENTVQQLNREHVDIAKELITRKVEMAQLQDHNDVLTQKVSDLTKIVDSQGKEVEEQYKGEIQDVLRKNMDYLKRNEQLEDQLSYMESLLVETKMKYAESEIERDSLARKLSDMKKALGAI